MRFRWYNSFRNKIIRDALIVLLLGTQTAGAMDSLVCSALHPSVSTTASVFFSSIGGAGLTTTEANTTTRMPVAGNIKAMYITMDAAPGAGKTFTFVLRQNSASPVSGSSCTVTGANTTCNDTVGLVNYLAGDTIDMSTSGTGTPAANTAAWCLLFSSATSNMGLIWGGATSAPSLAASNYISPQAAAGGNTNYSATVGDVEGVCPTAGTLSQLNVNLVTAAGVGKSWAWTLYQNGVATALTCTAANTTSCQDTTNSVAVVAGDRLALQITPAGSPAAGPGATRWSMQWAPTTNGESIQMFASTSAMQSNSVTQYNYPVGETQKLWTTFESSAAVPSAAVTAKKLYVSLEVAPGVASSYAFTLRDNSANTALTCTASGLSAPATCNDTADSVTVLAGDLLDLQQVPAVSPAATGIHLGWVSCISCGGAAPTVVPLRTLRGVGP